MFGIGLFEFVLIAVLVLLIFGPEQIPTVARTVAKLYREVRTTGNEFTGIFKQEMSSVEKDFKDLTDSVEESVRIDDTDFGSGSKGHRSVTGQRNQAGAFKRTATPQSWLQTKTLSGTDEDRIDETNDG